MANPKEKENVSWTAGTFLGGYWSFPREVGFHIVGNTGLVDNTVRIDIAEGISFPLGFLDQPQLNLYLSGSEETQSVRWSFLMLMSFPFEGPPSS